MMHHLTNMLGAGSVSISGAELQGLGPVLITIGFGLIILLLDAFQRPSSSRAYLASFAVLGLLLAGGATYLLWHENKALELFQGMVYLDGFSLAFTCIFLVSGALTVLLAGPYLRAQGIDRGEFYALVLFAVAGMILVASSANLIMIFLGIETMSLAAYVLAGFVRDSKQSAEAGMKYLLLGAISTGLLLYGISLVYGATGTTDLYEIGRLFGGAPLTSGSTQVQALVAPTRDFLEAGQATLVGGSGTLAAMPFIGMLLIAAALAFKVAAVPFHMWAPDVYSGTPTPAVGFMATAIKAAGFAAILRIFMVGFFELPGRNSQTGWTMFFFALCLLSMIVGNLAALVQDKLKRMLAYSSIAHAGYILVAVVATGYAGSREYTGSIVFYLVAYMFGTIGAFGILAYFATKGKEIETYEDLNGLGYKHPWLGFGMGVFMVSAAGIPPAAGFFAKFLVFRAAVGAAQGGPAPGMMIALVVVGILFSIAGVWYYLRVIVHMYMREPTREFAPIRSKGGAVALAICAAMTLLLGILPDRLSRLSDMAVSRMADGPDGPRALDIEEYDRILLEAEVQNQVEAPVP